jgi:DNA repair exonuclease SbcCD ATPase subunit
MKIPRKADVIEEVKQVLRRRLKVDTQEELCRLVLRKLQRKEEDSRLTPQRTKRIALTIPEIEVKARTKRTPRIERIEKCPVCGSQIAELKGRNLLDKPILIGFKCINCAFQCDLEAFMPMKYIFLWKG